MVKEPKSDTNFGLGLLHSDGAFHSATPNAETERPFWAATAWSPPREGPGPVLSGDTMGTGVDLHDVAWVMRKWDLHAPCMLPLRWA